MNSKSLSSRFFLESCNKIFLDSETFFSISKYFSQFWYIVFSILKYFSRLWNFFLDFNFFSLVHDFFLTLKYFSVFQIFFSRFCKFFLDFESFFLMATIGQLKKREINYYRKTKENDTIKGIKNERIKQPKQK